MDWLENERKRHNNLGGSYKGSLEKQTVNFINSTFKQSNTHKVVNIEGTKYEVRMVTEKKFTVASGYTVMKLMFLPYTKVDNGTYVNIGDKVWLTTYANNKELAPHTLIRECENSLEIEYRGEIYNYPCVLETRVRNTQNIKELDYVDLSLDSLKITLPYNEITNSIDLKQKFLIGDRAWEIQGKNNLTLVKDGRGLIELASKNVPLTQEMISKLEKKKQKDKVEIEIVGKDDVKVNTKEKYTVELYYNDEIIEPKKTTWKSKEGLINQEGLFRANCDIGDFYIEVEVEYIDGCGDLQSIKADKKITIYNEREWW